MLRRKTQPHEERSVKHPSPIIDSDLSPNPAGNPFLMSIKLGFQKDKKDCFPMCNLLSKALSKAPISGTFYIISIIGILIVSIPVFADPYFAGRVQVVRGYGLSNNPRKCVEDYYRKNNTFPTTNKECGIGSPQEITDGYYVESITIKNGKVIEIFSKTKATSDIAGKTIIFEPEIGKNNEINWKCSAGTVPNEYRPTICKNTQP